MVEGDFENHIFLIVIGVNKGIEVIKATFTVM